MISTFVKSLVITLTFGTVTLLNATDNTLNDQLFVAIRYGDLPAVHSLLKQGADANCIRSGFTPLMFAIATENLATIVEELLKHGANPNLQCDRYVKTPLVFAIQKEDITIVELLLKYGADANYIKSDVTPLLFAIDTEDLAVIVEGLLKHGANPNLQCYGYDETPLILAVQEGDVAIMELLLKYGAHPNAQDRNGKTALYFAQYDPKVVELLKAHGATE